MSVVANEQLVGWPISKSKHETWKFESEPGVAE